VPGLLALAAAVSCAAVLAVFLFLLYFAWPLFTADGFAQTFSWSWRPFQGEFGILPMVAGSAALAATAMALAYPLAVGICCFVHGMGPGRARGVVLAVVHFMTGVPTVVYGFVAVFLLVPRVRGLFERGSGFSWLSAALMLALLVLPTIVLVLHSQFRSIEPRVRLTTAALGMTQAQKFLHVVFPMARRGFAAAAVLGFGRALGDTLIPLMLAGNAAQPPASLLDSIRTLTAHVALVVATDSRSGAYLSLFACGMLLFLATVGVNLTLRLLAGTPRGEARHG
jgi:phosphate transport system permease protein